MRVRSFSGGVRLWSRLVWVSGVSLLAAVPPVAAQPEAGPTQKPVQSQTVAGVTLSLRRLKWVWPREVWGGTSKDDPKLRMLGYWFDVLEGDKPLLSYTLRTRHIGPFGQLLQPPSHFYQATEGWGGFNPRWPQAALELDLLERGATPAAAGEFETPLEFHGVPIPQPGQNAPLSTEVYNGPAQPRVQNATASAYTTSVVTPRRTLTTPHGTQVSIEQVTMRRHQDKPGVERASPDNLEFLVRWVSPPRYPEAQVQVALVEGGVHDETGRDLTEDVQIGTQNWSGYSEFGSETGREVNSGQTILCVHNLPAPRAYQVHLKMLVRETIPSLAHPNQVRHFHFNFDPRTVPFEKNLPQAALATAASDDCRVTVQDMQVYSGDQILLSTLTENTPAAGAQVATEDEAKDQAKDQAAPWHWRIEKWRLTSQQQPLVYDVWEQEPGSDFFHSDGTPLQHSEWGQTLHGVLLPATTTKAATTTPDAATAPPGVVPTGETAIPPQPTCNLEMQLRREQLKSHAVDFIALPIPPNDGELKLNRSVTLPDGSRLVVQSLHFVTEPAQMAFTRGPFAYDTPPTRRLALRLVFGPAPGLDQKFHFRRGSALDNKGYALLPENGLGSSGGDNFYEFKLFAPLPGVTQFDLHLLCDIVQRAAQQSLILHGLPLPHK